MIQTLSPSLTLPSFDAPVTHPAKYTPDILRVMSRYLKAGWLVYDPFGGVGGLHRISARTGAKTVCGEIESRVIANARGTRSLAANAMYLPFPAETFDAIATSPTYGNRMADSALEWTPRYRFNTYDRVFGFELHKFNTGQMNWGETYRRIHADAYKECDRVLKPGGLFLLNISDHIRAGERVYVSKWHLNVLCGRGLKLLKTHAIQTPRLRQGANWETRTACEYVFILVKEASHA